MASLPNVAQGDPHVKAHNDERTAINDLKILTETGRLSSDELSNSIAGGVTTGLNASQSLPANAGARTGRFDQTRSTYNFKATNFRKTRAKLAATLAGTGLWRVGTIGDSKVAGQTANLSTQSWPVQMRKLLAALGFPTAGTGVVVGSTSNIPAEADPRWSLTGSWARTNQTDKPSLSISSNGATATFTSDLPGTVVEIFTYGTTGSFTYAIDGAAAVAAVPSGASALQTITVTGLANTTHTVVITTTSATLVFVTGVCVRNNTGVLLSNLAISGSSTSSWTSTSYFQNRHLSITIPLDTVFISLMTNDARTGTPNPVTARTNLTSIATDHKNLGRDVVLVVPTASNTVDIPQVTWDAMVSAHYDVADALDLPLIDLTHRTGTWAAANANGLFTDSFHESPAGYAADAVSVVEAVR